MFGAERTHSDDPGYGFRKLVEIAERSVASPFNDPTTTVQAIDRRHDCLRQLAPGAFPDGHHHYDEGRLRLLVREMDWAGYCAWPSTSCGSNPRRRRRRPGRRGPRGRV